MSSASVDLDWTPTAQKYNLSDAIRYSMETKGKALHEKLKHIRSSRPDPNVSFILRFHCITLRGSIVQVNPHLIASSLHLSTAHSFATILAEEDERAYYLKTQAERKQRFVKDKRKMKTRGKEKVFCDCTIDNTEMEEEGGGGRRKRGGGRGRREMEGVVILVLFLCLCGFF